MANTKQGIYYPDNYNSVADVPEDMKKMAESIDAELENDRNRLETNETNMQALQTDNTTNKKDISDIKQEQTSQNANITKNASDIKNIQDKNTAQDKEIENINEKDINQDTNIETLTQRLNEKDNQIAELKAENEDLKADLSNSQIHVQVSGEYVHLSDSAKMECDIGILGNSRQETRQGYNKLPYPYSESTVTKKGVTFTVNEDGTIKVNGTPTEDAYFYLYQGKISDFKSIAELNGKKAKITQVPTGSSSTYYLSMYNFDNSGTSVYTQGRDSSYVTVDNQGQNVNIALCVKSGYVANNLVISPMILLEGETSTEYEQYGAMPSLEFESGIECVSSANVKVCNENIFDGELEAGGINYQNGTVESKTDRVRSKNFIKLDPNLQYTIRRIDGNGKAFGIRGYDENKNYVGYIAAVYSKTITFTPETSNSTDMPKPNTKFCYMKFIDLDNNLNAKYKIEQGTTATDYIPHEEQNYPVDMQEEMLEGDYFDLENEEEVHNWNETVLNGTENWVIATTLTNTIQYKLDVSGLNITSRNAKSENILVEQTYGDREQLVIGRNLINVFINFSKSRATTLEEFKALLNTNNIKLHYMSEPRKLDLTENQKAQLQALQKAKTYKNITNITTDTIAVLDVDYKRDLETYQKQQDDRITAIEQLLSTTATSAMLLDNVQSDLESEVK